VQVGQLLARVLLDSPQGLGQEPLRAQATPRRSDLSDGRDAHVLVCGLARRCGGSIVSLNENA
jgi:hypothetical protein